MLLVTFLLFTWLPCSHGAPTTGFLTRTGSQLLANGHPYRFSGANLYWLGLDENEGGVAYPTPFRVTDGLTTVAGLLPGTTIRAHTVGISTGNPKSFEPALGVFNHSALDAADWAIAEAERLGLRILVPLTDNWRYFHGGKHDFTTWCGSSDENAFYTLPCAIAAFKAYIAARLAHVNPYTGRAARDEPAVAAWETGNELGSATTAWTCAIADYIKSLDPNHLVMDGDLLASPDTPQHLAQCTAVDIFQQHFYPPNAALLEQQAAQVAAAGRVYIAGEYGWTSGSDFPYNATMLACQSSANCSGSCAWSFFPHADTLGFVQHGDGFTYHYPGETPPMRAFVAALGASGAAMAGAGAPAPLPAPLTPAVTAAQGGRLSWRGAALAATYQVQTAPTASGPWQDSGGTPADDSAPWAVPGGLPTGAWVRLRGVGEEGLTGPWSSPWLVSGVESQ